MCVIVDNDVVARVLLDPDDPDYAALYRALFGRKRPFARLVYGGLLATEYARNNAVRRAIAILDRAARARTVSGELINDQSAFVRATGHARSNDYHILGIARVSGARILCSADGELRDDFRDRRLVPTPKGKIFSNGGHLAMVRSGCRHIMA